MEAASVHASALCESTDIGAGTRIWAFVHILPGASIGRGCNICDGVFVENDVIIGDRVTIKCGVQLWDGIRIEDGVFIGPNATFTNDRKPRSTIHPATYAQTIVRRGASVGANATILPGVEIGAGAMVGAAAVVTRSVPPLAVVVGNPARIIGYVDVVSPAITSPTSSSAFPPNGMVATGVRGVTQFHLALINDMRGTLSVGEFEQTVPFRPKRYFLVFDVPNREIRGEHAHRSCHQFLVCVKGSVSVVVDDGTERQEFLLDGPNLGLHVSPMVWATQYKYSADAVLLVFASEHYDAADYIRNHDEFIRLLPRNQLG